MKKIILFFSIYLVFNSITIAQSLEWVKSIGGTGTFNVEGNSIIVDDLGNTYITGAFEGTVDFDPSNSVYNLSANFSVPNSSRDVFILRLDFAGNFIWAKSFGGIVDAWVNSINIDVWNNIYLTGRYEGLVDFDPSLSSYNLTSTGSSDIFAQKLDSSGNFIWARSFVERPPALLKSGNCPA